MHKNKLVAVLNEKIETGVVMNALAHASVGLGAYVGQEDLRPTDYVDADGQTHPHISEMPFIILKAKNSNKICALRNAAKELGIKYANFIDTMRAETFIEQLAKTKQTKSEDLEYYGIVLFGDWDKVTELTKRFSLWK